MCDMVPNAEHWRVSVAEAVALQDSIMGYLPGYATPRLVCDVPFVGKRWVHMVARYDRERGVSLWRGHAYYDPIRTLPEAGRRWWAEQEVTLPAQAAGEPTAVELVARVAVVAAAAGVATTAGVAATAGAAAVVAERSAELAVEAAG